MRNLLGIAAALTLTLLALTPVRAEDATDKEMQALLTKAIEARGGEQNLTKYKALTIKSKGKVHVMDLDSEYTSTVIQQQSDQLWIEMTFSIQGQNIVFLQGVHGDKGWRKLMDKLSDLDKDEMTESREAMHLQNAMNLVVLKDKSVYTLKPLGETKVGDQPAIGMLVSAKDRRDVSLYFDKKTYLLVKTEARGKDTQSGGEFTGETFYSDYKEVEGVKHAMKTVIKRDGKAFIESANTEVTPQDKLDDATFAKPK